ncbi:hypothetical protein [Nostoc flagelliforme]|uniref:hypothetical protein n=1 Tax=Nostoc flagelliforme TaxID=1306274 RepID=UPI001685F1BB|nr:hypothetical protein [Nostoc flagelliforme]
MNRIPHKCCSRVAIAITKTVILHIGIRFEQFSFPLCYFLDVFGRRSWHPFLEGKVGQPVQNLLQVTPFFLSTLAAGIPDMPAPMTAIRLFF